jgi:hypothetical protein
VGLQRGHRVQVRGRDERLGKYVDGDDPVDPENPLGILRV